MKSSWPTKKLGEVCDLYQPRTITSKEIKSDGPYKVFGANGVIGYYDKYNHEEPEVLVTCRGATCGTINLSEPKSWVTGNAMVVHPKDETDLLKKFLFWTLKSVNFSVAISGSAQPQITRKSLSPVEIVLPPIGEQRKIVEKIEKLFAKIDEASRLRAESYSASAALLPSALQQIFSRAEKDLWEKKSFGEVVEIDTTRNTKKKLPFIGMEDIGAGSGNFLGSRDPKEVRSITFHFDTRHVLYGKLRPYLNKFFLPNFEGHCTTEFLPLLPDNNHLIREWLVVWLRFEKTVDDIMAAATGTRMPRANMNQVKKLQIPLPLITEQKKIVAYLDSLSAKVRELRVLQSQTAEDLRALKQTILHQAFEGKL